MSKLHLPTITTVITTYNRRHCVARAIESAFEVLPGQHVIVVDDASQDGSYEYLLQLYPGEISNSDLVVIRLDQNVGVTGSKNIGYELALGDWVIFLDSDDLFIPGVGSLIEDVLKSSEKLPIVFFRCNDKNGLFVGRRLNQDLYLDLKMYLRHTTYGEALTAFNKKLVGMPPPYLSSLRGYEGLGCSRLIQKYGSARLSTIIARIYDTTGHDRLSVSSGLFRRLTLLARGHRMMAEEFSDFMSWHARLALYMKAISYSLLGSIYGLLEQKK